MPDAQPQLLIDSGEYKGLDAFTAGYYLDEKRATDILNILPDKQLGAFNTVLGRTPLVTTALPSALGGLAIYPLQGNAPTYIAESDEPTTGALWSGTNGANTWTQLALPSNVTLTSGKAYVFEQANEWLFGTNGTDTPFKIDTSLNVTAWGIVAPTAAPSAADSGSAGNLNGGYFWRYTYSNESQESSPSPISGEVSVTNHSVNLSGFVASTDPQVTTINIYRLGGTTQVWQFVGSISNGTSTANDDIADTALGQNMVLHRDPPPPFFSCLYLQDYMWGFGTPTDPCDLFFSNVQDPTSFDTTDQVIPIGRNVSGDTAQGLGNVGSVLICFKVKSTWAVYGSSSADWLPVKLFDIGCAAPRSITSALGIVLWLGWNDAWMFDGNEPTRISSQIHSVLNGLSTNDLSRAAATYRDGFWHLSLPTQGVTYSFVLSTREWYKIGWALECGAWDDSLVQVVGSRAGEGNVDIWFASTTDLGQPITAAFQGKLEDSKHPEAAKRYRFLELIAPIQAGQTATLTLTADPGPTQRIVTKELSLGTALRQQVSVPQNMLGYQGQLTLTVVATNAQVQIEKFNAWGWIVRRFAP